MIHWVKSSKVDLNQPISGQNLNLINYGADKLSAGKI
jgi:hypothetical protein